MNDRSDPQRGPQTDVTVQTEQAALPGILTVPDEATSLVLFAHGSGSSRFSSRNQFVAGVLNEATIATLLFDLLTSEEHAIDQRTRHLRFDIGLLSDRLVGAIDWAQRAEVTRSLNIGLFGASTGAAAALIAATERPDVVGAVVSRGGRPDLAGRALRNVRAPTLLIVGALDIQVIELNRDAARELQAEQRIEIVPGASHLFEEPGTLEQAAALARDWFSEHLHRTP
ncbi:MAG: dienelactone hydrolase family protein [Phycisphaeraceae bacterium]